MVVANNPKDFFISYTKADRQWAEWIAWCLEQAYYNVIIEAWDFPIGSNVIHKKNQAIRGTSRFIAVLSPDYLESQQAIAEWTALFEYDPDGEQGLLIPVRVRPCEIRNLFGPRTYIDLVNKDEQIAQDLLIEGVHEKGPHPLHISFPGNSHSVTRPTRFPGTLPTFWTVPYSHNPYFTGRQELLRGLARRLRVDQPQPMAIWGLGGIGKTQIAVEYVYDYHHDYEAIFWVQADAREKLNSGFVQIAETLGLTEKGIKEQKSVNLEVLKWLRTHTKWLLILDNADDQDLVREFIPQTLSGHVLLTTRRQGIGSRVHYVNVEYLSDKQGALLLLRQAALINHDATLENASQDDVDLATQLAGEMGGLPLALAQAGAYIKENRESLKDYSTLYKEKSSDILKRRPSRDIGYLHSVEETFSISFDKVLEEKNGAAQFLQLFSCLASENIPRSIITEGGTYLGPFLQAIVVNREQSAAIETLIKYSLISSDPNSETLIVHRLIKSVIYDGMTFSMRQQWINRAVQALNAVFPDTIEIATRKQCQLLLPHIKECIFKQDNQIQPSPEAVQVLIRAGAYLRKSAQYEEAQLFLNWAGAINQPLQQTQMKNSSHYYYTKARLACDQGDYNNAEEFYNKSLEIQKNFFGEENPETLLNLGRLYHIKGMYKEAEPLLLKALEIREQKLAQTHAFRDKAWILHFLGEMYRVLGKYSSAEERLLQALEIRSDKTIRGPKHPETARTLNDLGALYRDLARYREAGKLLKEAFVIRKDVLGDEHPDTLVSYHSLARLYYLRKEYKRAEEYAKQALNTRKRLFNEDHPRIAQSYCDIAAILSKKGVHEKEEHYFKEAEDYLQKSLEIYSTKFGAEHSDVAFCMNDLAALYVEWGKNYDKAQELVQKAMSIYKKVFEDQHPRVAATLTVRANLLLHEQNYEQAEADYLQASGTYEQVFGGTHPDLLSVLKPYSSLLYTVGRLKEAESIKTRISNIETLDEKNIDESQDEKNIDESQ